MYNILGPTPAVEAETPGTGNALEVDPARSENLLGRGERGKVSAGGDSAPGLWDMPSPAATQPVTRRHGRELPPGRGSWFNENRERELGLDRRETG
jgi:hypothetical protein